jgi:hypothetical protein
METASSCRSHGLSKPSHCRANTALMPCRYVPENGILTLLYHTEPGCSRPAVRRKLANNTAVGPLLDALDGQPEA